MIEYNLIILVALGIIGIMFCSTGWYYAGLYYGRYLEKEEQSSGGKKA